MYGNRPKYIAEGYVEDAGKLMKEFLELNSVELPDFATLWRKHHFSLIFMGRPTDAELTEFVNEIFKLTSQYLLQDSFYQKVGGVFILYALYNTQISKPPIKIRLEMKHWDAIKSLREVAFKEQYKTLHYVLDYLLENACLYVARQTLRGPLIVCVPTEHDVCLNKLKSEYRETFDEFSKSNRLREVCDLHKQYTEAKSKFAGNSELLSVSKHEFYEENARTFQEYFDFEREMEEHDILASKRLLKTEAFQRTSKTKSDIIAAKLDNLASGTSSKKESTTKTVISFKPKKSPERPRKQDKRPGRPPKYPKPPKPLPVPDSDDEIDITYLVEQQKDLYLPPEFGQVRKNRTKRDPYFKTSPKRKETYDDSSTSE